MNNEKLCKENKRLKRLLRRWKKILEPFPVVSDLKALSKFMKDSPHGTTEDAEYLHKMAKSYEKKNRKLYDDTEKALK